MAITYVKSPWWPVSESISESAGNLMKMFLMMSQKNLETKAAPLKEAMGVSPEVAQETYPLNEQNLPMYEAYRALYGEPTKVSTPEQQENKFILGLKPGEKESLWKGKLGITRTGAQEQTATESRRQHVAALVSKGLADSFTVEGKPATTKELQSYYESVTEGYPPPFELGPPLDKVNETQRIKELSMQLQPLHGKNYNQIDPASQQMVQFAMMLKLPVEVKADGTINTLKVEEPKAPEIKSFDRGEKHITEIYQDGKLIRTEEAPRWEGRIPESEKYLPAHVADSIDEAAVADYLPIAEQNLAAQMGDMAKAREIINSLKENFTGKTRVEQIQKYLRPEQVTAMNNARVEAQNMAKASKVGGLEAWQGAKKKAKEAYSAVGEPKGGTAGAEKALEKKTNPLKGQGVQEFKGGTLIPKPGKAMSPGAAMKKVEEGAKTPKPPEGQKQVSVQVPKEKEEAVSKRMLELQAAGKNSQQIIEMIKAELLEGKL